MSRFEHDPTRDYNQPPDLSMPFFVTGYNPDSNFETSGYQTLCKLQYHEADPICLSLIFERNLDDQGEPKKMDY